MTAMTVFFPLDTARLRLQGKCQTSFCMMVFLFSLAWALARVVVGEPILHEQESYLCNTNIV